MEARQSDAVSSGLAPQTYSVVITSVADGVIKRDMLYIWDFAHTDSLAFGIRVNVMGKVK